MDDTTQKLIIFGGAIAIILVIILITAICYCRRRRRRRIHMERMTIESPNPSYKTNLATITPSLEFNHRKPLDSYDYGGILQHSHQVQNGFSQVFRGSPTFPRKTFEAPPPPPISTSPCHFDSKAHSPYGGSGGGGTASLRSVIIIDGEENNCHKSGNNIRTRTMSSPKPGAVSPKLDRLSLKNRPFHQELAESKTIGTQSNPSKPERAQSPKLPKSPLKQRHLQKETLPKSSLSNGLITKTPVKMEKLQENENEMLYYEFEILNQEAMTTIKPRTTTAELSENIRKNRYYDILPYDFNRVKLKNLSFDGTSRINDYINASYINMDDGTLRYIAAQSPIGDEEASGGRRTKTIADFWQMIWQERVDTIVMLSECVEENRQKCAQYWPENAGVESIAVGNDLSVNLYCITEDEISFQREMYLHKAGESKRKIMQWQYKAWRDTEGAADAENLLTFMDALRTTERHSPILVHCSAGSGRTGVFIAVDILLDKLVRENVIDVFDTVSRLRDSRANMVQTGEQYLTIYEAIALAIRRRTAVRASG